MISHQEASRAFGGRYRLLEFVGEGPNGRVYVAGDLTLRRRVALKILRADLAERAGFPERFADEMRATSALSHPRVLPVYDWGLDPQPYTVTEYLAGGSLAGVLRAGYRLTPSQALEVGLEAARALTNIHKGDRAHLGLTPASILFDSSARPYISDLGLAAALAATAEQPAETGEPDPTGGAAAATGGAAAETSADGAATGGPAAEASADGAAAAEGQGGEPVSYSRIDQAQDVRDLALVLCEAVTGNRDLATDARDPDSVPVTALGPLQAVLERAAADAIGRLTAAELSSELLRVAPLLPRPDPLPLAVSQTPPADAGPARADSRGDFEQIGPTVSERSAIPHDDIPRRRWPGLVLAAVLVLGGAAGGVWAWLSSSDDPTVPDLGGRPRAAAASAAAESGWDLNEILVRTPNTESGEVVRTEPAAGAPLGAGDTLDVFVSLGEPLVLVADLDVVYGMTVDDAADELRAAGLDLAGETPVNDDVVPAGNVIGLDVAGGVYELEVGREVVLLVSEGPADRTVPRVPESRELEAAAAGLDAVGLVPRLVQEFSAEVAEGAVIGFRPASGNSLPIGNTVEVRVSLGPEPDESADGEEGLDSEGQESDGDDSDGDGSGGEGAGGEGDGGDGSGGEGSDG